MNYVALKLFLASLVLFIFFERQWRDLNKDILALLSFVFEVLAVISAITFIFTSYPT